MITLLGRVSLRRHDILIDYFGERKETRVSRSVRRKGGALESVEGKRVMKLRILCT